MAENRKKTQRDRYEEQQEDIEAEGFHGSGLPGEREGDAPKGERPPRGTKSPGSGAAGKTPPSRGTGRGKTKAPD